MFVEEVPKKSNANSSTIYFTSSINLTARPSRINHETDVQPVAKKAKINYNLNDLMTAQLQSNDSQQSAGPLKSSQQITLERLTSKRLLELSKEGPVTNFELPKNYESKNNNKKNKQGNTPGTKKILSAKRNLNSYFEEERNLVSINSILSLNYQYLDQYDYLSSKKNKKEKIFRPRIKLCCICSNVSNYARCHICGLFFCSIKCNRVHQDSRCN